MWCKYTREFHNVPTLTSPSSDLHSDTQHCEDMGCTNSRMCAHDRQAFLQYAFIHINDMPSCAKRSNPHACTRALYTPMNADDSPTRLNMIVCMEAPANTCIKTANALRVALTFTTSAAVCHCHGNSKYYLKKLYAIAVAPAGKETTTIFSLHCVKLLTPALKWNK